MLPVKIHERIMGLKLSCTVWLEASVISPSCCFNLFNVLKHWCIRCGTNNVCILWTLIFIVVRWDYSSRNAVIHRIRQNIIWQSNLQVSVTEFGERERERERERRERGERERKREREKEREKYSYEPHPTVAKYQEKRSGKRSYRSPSFRIFRISLFWKQVWVLWIQQVSEIGLHNSDFRTIMCA